MRKWLSIAVGAALVALAARSYLQWRNSPAREIERCGAALAHARSWHFHTVQQFLNNPPETRDVYTVCPLFEHTIKQGSSLNGTPVRVEFIKFQGAAYVSQNSGPWARTKGDADIRDCSRGPVADGDGNTLPFDAILGEAAISRGELHQSGDASCRDYEFLVPVPTNLLHKQHRFDICINEQDHLPRETRHKQQYFEQEDVYSYTEWNAATEPQLPPGFPN